MEARFSQPENWQWGVLMPRAGQHLRYGWALPTSPIGFVVIFPGLSEYCEKYFEIAHDLLAKNFGVAVLDWRGQGKSWRYLSERERRHSDGFENDLADAKLYIDALPIPKNLPRIMLGHSMGGHLALRTLHDMPKSAFNCAVLTAPMMGLAVAEWMAIGVANTLHLMGMGDHFMPTNGPYSPGTLNSNLNILTSDGPRADIQRHWMKTDPDLRTGGVTAGWMRAAHASMHIARAPAYLSAIKTPCLLIEGGHEMVVSNQDIQATADKLPDATLVHIPGCLHEVMMEQDAYRNKFWDAFHPFVAKNLKPR